MITARLHPHPATPPNTVEGIAVRVAYDDGHIVVLTFHVSGSDDMVVQDWEASARAPDLWRSTCFELFVRAPGAQDYLEFNFSPSTQWAAYRFDGYRSGRQDLALAVAPHIDRQGQDPVRGIEVDLDRADFPAAMRMALSAVIEETDGTLSYWALVHPSDVPDFHHRDSFVLELPAIR